MIREITKDQIKIIHTLLSKTGLQEQKRSMISDVSYGRTESTTKLTYQEAAELIGYLQKGSREDGKTGRQEVDQKIIRMRKKFFAMCFEIGWIVDKQVIDDNGKLVMKKDYETVNKWLLKFGYLHQELNKYTNKELPKLLSQFEFGPYKQYMEKL